MPAPDLTRLQTEILIMLGKDGGWNALDIPAERHAAWTLRDLGLAVFARDKATWPGPSLFRISYEGRRLLARLPS
jgi:hypothetical protein